MPPVVTIAENPLVEATLERVAPPAVLVVFGASGDLTSRKLMPAIEQLALRRLLPGGFSVVGVARTEMTDDDFLNHMRKVVDEGRTDDEDAQHVWQAFSDGGFRYVSGDYGAPETFATLRDVLDDIDRTRGTSGNRLYYLATPPTTFETIVTALGEAGLNHPTTDDAFVRIVIEKPFGHDQRTATQLDTVVHSVFEESQVYRIDHYLGKETVQNVLALRFANAIFEPVW
ncbi:MAG TPA: glucose-6-phosphate dehydrogenase, partial [Acidimicrobiales bacterium]